MTLAQVKMGKRKRRAEQVWVRGYYLAGRADKLSNFISSLAVQEVLAFSQSTAELAGKIDADLQRTGQPIGRADPMIAATAIEHGLVLVTGNTSHFARIQAIGYPLVLDNWMASASPSP
jgi:tRNA(fMet)-specific endonuclease VapC